MRTSELPGWVTRYKDSLVTLGAVAIGIVLFLCIYGYQVLIPTNVDWLLAGGDLSQHYIGWEFYRQSAWTFPIGVASDLAYPHGLAITFMDSLPLLAIPFKLVGGILPDHFQYFGWWGLFCFMATAVVSAKIVSRWTRRPLVILAVAAFFCASPVVLQRMFSHTALAGHWVILLGIYGIVWGRKWGSRRSVAVWATILSLSVLIHPYILLMNVFLMVLALVLRYVTVKRSAIEAVIPIAVAAIVTWAIGGFTFSNISGENLGKAGYDLISSIAPNGWSLFFHGVYPTHYEAFGYFGLGGLALLIITGAYLFRARRTRLTLGINEKRKLVALLVLFAVLMLVALSPTIRFDGLALFSYHVPVVIEKLWSIFRVTARLMWPVYYLLMFAGIYTVLRLSRKVRFTNVIIVLLCLVQVIDLFGSSQLASRHERFVNTGSVRYESQLSDVRWRELAVGRKHLVYLGNLYEGDFVMFAQYSIDNKLSLNTGYFARKPTKSIQNTIDQAKSDLKDGHADKRSIYVSKERYPIGAGLSQQDIDGFILTTTSEAAGR